MNTKKRKRKKNHNTPIRAIVGASLLIYSITLLIPFAWGFLISLKTREEYIGNPVFSLPSTFRLSNFLAAWTELANEGIGMIDMLINSLWYSVGTVIISLALSIVTAYVVAKYRFPGRNFIYYFTLITLMLPLMGNMASSLRFMQMIGVYNSPLYMIFGSSATGVIFLIFYSTFKSLSWEYAEAAFIDGAGHFRIMRSIMVPQVMHIISAIFVTEFIVRWSDSATPLIYFPSLPTLASGLLEYQTIAQREMNYPIFFAALMMCMIPVLILFFIFQENLMDIQMGGGLKG